MDWLRRLSLILPCAGLFVSGYLSVYHMLGLDAACGPKKGCSDVATWVDKNLGGFPIAYVGMAGYLLLFIIGLYGLVRKDTVVKPGLVVSGAGFLASVGLMILSFGVIKATCLWCVASALIMTATFGVYLLMKKEPTAWKPDGVDFGLTAFGLLGSLLGLSYVINAALASLPGNAPGTIDKYVPQNAKIYGKVDAPITIVEFFAFTCHHCRDSFIPMKELIDKSNGQARLVMLHFPFLTEEHAMSAPAAAVSEMAHEKGKYFEFAEKVFSYDTKTLDMEKIVEAGVWVGLDPATIKKRLENPQDAIFKNVEHDMKISSGLGVELTPTYLVGRKGTRVDVLTMRQIIPTMTGVRYGLPKPAGL